MDCRTEHNIYSYLLALLKQEASLIASIVNTSSMLQESLISFDAHGIEFHTNQQEQTLKQLSELEHQRNTCIARLLGISEEQARKLTITEFLSLLPDRQRELFEQCCAKLREQLAELQTVNGLNRLLAVRGRNSIRTTLEFIQEGNVHILNTAC